ncbi:MAG: LacI family DNA-binding transcriptional regulator [Spirochaetales bacterium]|nr:LacI family DNA-binding transcriptional regulator [Spirochaetales bacterium]
MDIPQIITIKDIAEKAGVSIGTVDRVVHDRGRVSEETAKKVRAIIEELGYKPNMFASRLSRSKIYQFGVLVPKREQDSHYWETSLLGVEKAAEELGHYGIQVKYFFFDRYASESAFFQVVDEMLASRIDGLLIAPVAHDPVVKLIKKIKKHIPFVFMNTMLPEFQPVSFIGQDSYQSGVVCGKLMQILLRNQGTVAVILPVPNDMHIRRRADGFRLQFKHDQMVSIKEYETDNFEDKNSCQMLLEHVFADSPDLQGIFVTNVCTHYVASFIQNHQQYGKKVSLIGYDLIQENIDFLKVNMIDFLISQKPERQGYEGIYTLYRTVVLKEKCPKNILMPIDIITKENVSYYISNKF